MLLLPYGLCCVQTTDDVIVGQTREKVNEFVYDYSYWSLDPNDPHFIPQEQVYTFLPWVGCF